MTVTRRRTLGLGAALPFAAPAIVRAQGAVELVVQYPAPNLFQTLHELIVERFHAAQSAIRVTFRAPYEDYEDGLQKTLRDAITRTLPDVSYQGVDRQRTLAERNIPVDIRPLMEADPETPSLGFSPALLSLGRIGATQTGIGFSLSTPIFYYNLDALKRAGHDGETLPTSWDEMMALANAIGEANPGMTPFFFNWPITGNWSWQALVFSHGGRMMDEAETRVGFGDEPGRQSIRLLRRFVDAAKMPDIRPQTMFSDFFAGRLGIMMESTAQLARVTRESGGRFAVKTGRFPLAHPDGRLPVGGNVAMILAREPAKQRAAWEYIKFACGPQGATLMVQNTGYMPATTVPSEREDMLAPWYRERPNWLTSLAQLPVLTGWYAFPGQNALRITDVINDHLQSVVARRAEPEAALRAMVDDVTALLPRRRT